MPPSRKITTFLTAATLVVAAACSAKDAPTGPTPTGPSGRLRVVNATPDPTRGGAANVKIGDQVFAVNVAYGAATGYQRVYTGPRDLHLRRTSDTTRKRRTAFCFARAKLRSAGNCIGRPKSSRHSASSCLTRLV